MATTQSPTGTQAPTAAFYDPNQGLGNNKASSVFYSFNVIAILVIVSLKFIIL